MQNFIDVFKNIELRNRVFLSRHKILYAIIGGAGIILYWRGIWMTADLLQKIGSHNIEHFWGYIFYYVFSGPGTAILGIIVLLLTGLLVQEFIGNDIIISGIKKEKKIVDKTEEEILREIEEEEINKKLLQEIDSHIHNIKTINVCESEIKTPGNKNS